MTDILLTYGTLRPNKGETVLIPGAIFDLGWFPGLKLDGTGFVVCEKVPVEDWTPLDRYEGYDDNDPSSSLYIRRCLRIPHGIDAFVYEYNRPVDFSKKIIGGDWIPYSQNKNEKENGNLSE